MRSIIILSLLFVSNNLFSQKSNRLSASEFLINSTVKIETVKPVFSNGVSKDYIFTGTGFFFNFNLTVGELPVIVTNRHVLEGAKEISFYFKFYDSLGSISYTHSEKLNIDALKWLIINHPDSTIDLAIIPIQPLFYNQKQLKKSIVSAAYRESNIPNDSVQKTFTAIEDVYMIGYPFGLKDNTSGLPIVRKGITSTPLYLNYNLKPEFLCDIPVYPGSSGSPIIVYSPNGYLTNNSDWVYGFRLWLTGINYATYTSDFKGKITPIISQNPSDSNVVITPIPYNIGIVIKSQKLLDFKPLFLTTLSSAQPTPPAGN